MIDILLATYNGEKFLGEQIDSILNQTYHDWRIIVSDDCSKDSTIELLKYYKDKYPDKFEIHLNKKSSGGAKYNFYKLINLAKNQYVMFCDQDDVWCKDKIETTFNAMLAAEKRFGVNTPLLVHSDLCVVDKQLNVINKSMFAMQNMNCHKDKLNNLLVTNIVTGCTMMINKALLELANVQPRYFVMHDMWLALIAATFGHIEFINSSTILYRQHGDNSVGAKDVASWKYVIDKIKNLDKVRENLSLQYKQAGELLRLYPEISPEYRPVLEDYSHMNNIGCLKKMAVLQKHQMFKDGYIKAIAQVLL